MSGTTDQYYATQAPPQQRPFSGLAITGFVFSLLWLGGLGSLVAIVTCGIAMQRTRQRNEAGRGLAVAGLIIGILGLIAATWTIVVLASAGAAMQSQFDTVSQCLNQNPVPANCH